MKKPTGKRKDKRTALRRARMRSEKRELATAAAQQRHLQTEDKDHQEAPTHEAVTATPGPAMATAKATASEKAAPEINQRPLQAASCDAASAAPSPLQGPREAKRKLPPAPPGPGQPRLVIITSMGRNTGALRQCRQCEEYFNSDGPSQVYCHVACYLKHKEKGRQHHSLHENQGPPGPGGNPLDRHEYRGALEGAGSRLQAA